LINSEKSSGALPRISAKMLPIDQTLMDLVYLYAFRITSEALYRIAKKYFLEQEENWGSIIM